MTMRRNLMRATAAAALAFTLAPVVHAQDVIKIGEINSYKAQPAFLEPYKKGMELAVDEINASGGVLGKKVQLIIRDDNANPGDAVRAAEELVSREKVDVLTGSFISHVGQALTDFAERVNIPEVRQVTSLLQRGDQLGTQLTPSLLDQADHFRTTRRQMATLQANKAPVKLTLPLMFCFAPAVLILLISPAMLELQEFLNPREGRSLLAGNEQLNTGRIVRTIEGLDQDLQLTTEE